MRLEPAAPVNTGRSGSGAAGGGLGGLCPTKPRHLVTGKGVSLHGQGQSAHTDWSLHPQHRPHPALNATRAGPWPRAFVDHRPRGLSLWGGAHLQLLPTYIQLHTLPTGFGDDPASSFLPKPARVSPFGWRTRPQLFRQRFWPGFESWARGSGRPGF